MGITNNTNFDTVENAFEYRSDDESVSEAICVHAKRPDFHILSSAGIMLERGTGKQSANINSYLTGDGFLFHPSLEKGKIILDAWNTVSLPNLALKDRENWIPLDKETYDSINGIEINLNHLVGSALTTDQARTHSFWNTLARSPDFVPREKAFDRDLLPWYIDWCKKQRRNENKDYFDKLFFSIDFCHKDFNTDAWTDLREKATLWPIGLASTYVGSYARIKSIEESYNEFCRMIHAAPESLDKQRKISVKEATSLRR